MRRRVAFGIPILLAMLPSQADAGLLPVHVGTSAEGENYRYTYGIDLQSGAMLRPGDFFTIYDFAGYIDGSTTQPAGFTFSTTMTGPTPEGVLPNDDGGVANLTWTYSGSETIGPAELGEFSALSSFEESSTDSFTGMSHRVIDGKLNSNITETEVPVPLATCNPQVPEPSTIILLAAGLPVLLSVWRIRNRLV